MSRDHTIKGERYWTCDLCGFTYRWSDTVLNSAGLRVCKKHDVDEGEYRFAPQPPYDINSPVYFDVIQNQYYQLQSQNQVLVANPIPNMGGFIPRPYTVVDMSSRKQYQLFISNGEVYLNPGVNGKEIPLLFDAIDGSLQQLQASNISGAISLIMVSSPFPLGVTNNSGYPPNCQET